MKTFKERREEDRKYQMDVDCEVWRHGGNSNAIDYDRVTDAYYEGVEPERCAKRELHLQRQARNRRLEEE